MTPMAEGGAPAALVFDMDGLLLDTERLALDGFLHACRVSGVTPNVAAYRRTIGTRMRDSRRILVDGHGRGFPFDAVYTAWGEYANDFRREPMAVKPGAREILATAQQAGLPCGLATSTREPFATEKLAAAGLDGFFAVKVTGDRVERGKPHPEPYARAASELGVDAPRSWAFEDSGHGVRSATAAGCRVFQVPDLLPPDDAVRAIGHVILDSLHDADALLRNVLGGQ